MIIVVSMFSSTCRALASRPSPTKSTKPCSAWSKSRKRWTRDSIASCCRAPATIRATWAWRRAKNCCASRTAGMRPSSPVSSSWAWVSMELPQVAPVNWNLVPNCVWPAQDLCGFASRPEWRPDAGLAGRFFADRRRRRGRRVALQVLAAARLQRRWQIEAEAALPAPGDANDRNESKCFAWLQFFWISSFDLWLT